MCALSLVFAESRGNGLRDLLDDLRANIVWRHWHTNKDLRVERRHVLLRHQCSPSGNCHQNWNNRDLRNWQQPEHEGEGLHCPRVDDQSHRSSGTGAHSPRRGGQKQSPGGALRRDGAHALRPVHITHRAVGSDSYLVIGSQVAHQDNNARYAARGMADSTALHQGYFHHQ